MKLLLSAIDPFVCIAFDIIANAAESDGWFIFSNSYTDTRT